MEKDQIKNIITTIRKTYPTLSLKNTINDIESAVEAFGVQVKYSDMCLVPNGANISSYVLSQNNKPVIIVQAHLLATDIRFAIARELARVFLHWGWLPGDVLPADIAEVSYRDKSNLSKEELQKDREANQFAAEFLAPLEQVKEIIAASTSMDDEIIKKIAFTFKIPHQLAAIRFGESL